MLVGAVTALHSPFDSLMSHNTRGVKEVTGQMTSGTQRRKIFILCADVALGLERM